MRVKLFRLCKGSCKLQVLRISIVLLHSILIVLFSYLWLNQALAHDSEEKLFTNFTIVKKGLLGKDHSPDRYTKDLLCINTSYSKMLIPTYDEYGLKRGDVAITDRVLLAELFHQLNTYNTHKYVLCDIMFDQVSPVDSLLGKALGNTRNLIVPQYFEGDSLVKPIFKVNSAEVSYLSNAYSNQFSKFKAIRKDGLESVPYAMYREIDQGKISRKGWFYFDDKRLCLNSNFIDFKVENVFESGQTYYDLNQFLKFLKYSDAGAVSAFLKDKVILVGAFENEDIHQSMYGSIPGILILYNTYLNLKEGLHIIPFLLKLILFLVFFILSYRIFYSQPIFRFRFLKRLKNESLWLLISSLLSYTFLFGLLSILSSMLFNIIINIYLIAIYFTLLETIMKTINEKASSRAIP